MRRKCFLSHRTLSLPHSIEKFPHWYTSLAINFPFFKWQHLRGNIYIHKTGKWTKIHFSFLFHVFPSSVHSLLETRANYIGKTHTHNSVTFWPLSWEGLRICAEEIFDATKDIYSKKQIKNLKYTYILTHTR